MRTSVKSFSLFFCSSFYVVAFCLIFALHSVASFFFSKYTELMTSARTPTLSLFLLVGLCYLNSHKIWGYLVSCKFQFYLVCMQTLTGSSLKAVFMFLLTISLNLYHIKHTFHKHFSPSTNLEVLFRIRCPRWTIL